MKSEYFKRRKHKHRRGIVLVGVNIFWGPSVHTYRSGNPRILRGANISNEEAQLNWCKYFKAPVSTRIDPDILKTEISFLPFSLSSTSKRRFWATKTHVFENRLSRVKIFENFNVCTQDENGGLRTRLCHTSSLILHYACLALSRGKGENDSKMLLEEAYFFLKTEIKKYPDTCGRGLNS